MDVIYFTHGATDPLIIVTRNRDLDLDISAGMGVVFQANEPYSLKSHTGANLIIVESDELHPHERGISSPERIPGETWPSDALLSKHCG